MISFNERKENILNSFNTINLEAEDLLICIDIYEYAYLLNNFFLVLSSDEQVRAKRYLVEHAYKEFVIARSYLRLILGVLLGCGSDKIPFTQNKWGKLYVEKNSVYFNVTHSKQFSVIGISKSSELGVDSEYKRDNVKFSDLAHRFFSKAEQEWLNQFPSENIKDGFYDIWTGKEAVSKAVGMGMSLSLDSYSVIPSDMNCYVELPVCNANSYLLSWKLDYISFHDDYSCCVCRSDYDKPVRFISL